MTIFNFSSGVIFKARTTCLFNGFTKLNTFPALLPLYSTLNTNLYELSISIVSVLQGYLSLETAVPSANPNRPN